MEPITELSESRGLWMHALLGEDLNSVHRQLMKPEIDILRTREAADGVISHHDFLFRARCDEVQRRDSKQLEQRLRRASFETTKRLEDFEWAFNPKVPKSKLVDLATCNFFEKQENVLLIGPTGVGKSHLAQAIVERACRAGHSVAYVSAHRRGRAPAAPDIPPRWSSDTCCLTAGRSRRTGGR